MAGNKSYNLASIGKYFGNGLSKITQKAQSALPPNEISAERNTSALFFKSAILYLLKKSAIVLISYLFGSSGALFNTYPFGLALLCASSHNIIYIYIGLLLSALSIRGESTAFFLVYTACVIMRFAFSKWMTEENGSGKNASVVNTAFFNEPFSLRLLTVIICSLSVSLARLISDGFLYYDLFALFVCISACPLLFCAYYYPANTKNASSQLLKLCHAVLIFSIIYSVRLYYILDFSVAIVASYLITLYAAKKLGVLKGCVLGLFAGLACDISVAPMFAVIGFVFGTISAYSLFGAVSASCITGLLFGIATQGFAAFSTLLPELSLASAIFLPLAYYDLLPKTELFLSENIVLAKETESAIINEEKLKNSTEALSAVSASFDALSTTIAALSDKLKRPDILDIKEICQNSFNKYCTKCSLAGVCYGKDCSSTFDLFGKFTLALNKKGRVDIGDVPEHIGSKCFNILKIVSEINLSYSKHIEMLIKSDKTSIFAIDYKALSKLITDASRINDEEYEPNRELSKKIAKALRYMDIDADGIFTYGKRRRHVAITGMNLSQIKMGTPELRKILENICETRLTLPVFEIEDDRVTLNAQSERIFDVKVAKAGLKMDSSDINGDTSVSFENRDDCFFFLISDGMGSGSEAAMTSRLCAVFLNKLLSAGCATSIVLELLNGFIRNKNGECSSTVDLAQLDLLTGKGCFVKSGAAPSYILRQNNLYKLQSKTLPLGILKDTDAEVINFELHDEDIIVMFSDGVASSLEDGVWLTSLLCFEFEDDLDKMAQKILERARADNSKIDDMTVALIKIQKKPRD